MEPVPVSRAVLNCFRERGQTWVDRGLLRLVRKVRAVSAEVAALSVTAVPLRLTITLIDPDWWPVDTPGEVVAPLLATSLFLPLLRGHAFCLLRGDLVVTAVAIVGEGGRGRAGAGVGQGIRRKEPVRSCAR